MSLTRVIPTDIQVAADRADLIPPDVQQAFVRAMCLMEDAGVLEDEDRAKMVLAIRLTFACLAVPR